MRQNFKDVWLGLCVTDCQTGLFLKKSVTAGIRLVCGLLVLASLSSPLLAQTWAVGTEREVDSGYYMKLTYSSEGWRVWSTETKDGLSCRAVKSAVGRPHPVPIGVRGELYQGTPYVSVSANYKGETSISLVGRWGGGGKWRDPKARFWNEEFHFGELFLRDGRKIEVDIDTWEYPASYVGLSQERGIVNLSGFDEAMYALKVCDPAIKIPDKRDPHTPEVKSRRSSLGRFRRNVMEVIPVGKVRYRAEIAKNGKAMTCTILESSGNDAVDIYICDIVQNRWDFFPALDQDFRPTSGIYEGDLKWRVQDAPSS